MERPPESENERERLVADTVGELASFSIYVRFLQNNEGEIALNASLFESISDYKKNFEIQFEALKDKFQSFRELFEKASDYLPYDIIESSRKAMEFAEKLLKKYEVESLLIDLCIVLEDVEKSEKDIVDLNQPSSLVDERGFILMRHEVLKSKIEILKSRLSELSERQRKLAEELIVTAEIYLAGHTNNKEKVNLN